MFCPYFHFFHREPHIVLVNLAVRLRKLALLDTVIMQGGWQNLQRKWGCGLTHLRIPSSIHFAQSTYLIRALNLDPCCLLELEELLNA